MMSITENQVKARLKTCMSPESTVYMVMAIAQEAYSEGVSDMKDVALDVYRDLDTKNDQAISDLYRTNENATILESQLNHQY